VPEISFLREEFPDYEASTLLQVYVFKTDCGRTELFIYVTSRKVRGSRPDEVNEFLSIYLIFQAALGPGVHSASNRNKYQKQKNNVSEEQSVAGAYG
jgi:hypothetical protein